MRCYLLFFKFFACLALILLCPVAVKADEEHEKFGAVIGIGEPGDILIFRQSTKMHFEDLGTM